MKPLHRAIGAKNWLGEPPHRARFPDWSGVATYREPFFFGGSVFWRVVAESEAGRRGAVRAVLGDANPFVCDLLLAVRDHPHELLAALADRPSGPGTFASSKHRLNEWIKRSRDMEPACLVPRAADFLAMMVLGFNGLWRVNREGQINVPPGKTASGKPAKMPIAARIMEAHRALVLCRAEVRVADFEEQLRDVGPGDLCYLDPPYEDSFAGYTALAFRSAKKAAVEQGSLFAVKDTLPTASDLMRLAETCERIDGAGGRFLLSNLDTPVVRAMFSRFRIERVEVEHSVSCDAETRGRVSEVLVSNY